LLALITVIGKDDVLCNQTHFRPESRPLFLISPVASNYQKQLLKGDTGKWANEQNLPDKIFRLRYYFNPKSMNKTRDSPKPLSQAALSGFVHRFGKSTKPLNEQNDFGANEQNPACLVRGRVEISPRPLRGNTTRP
jgi:hypothetical protein